MKKIFSAIVCAAALLTVSCVKDEVYDNALPTGGGQTIPTEFSKLVLNEIDGNAKFIELYNNGTEAVSLAGYTLVKNEQETVWTGAGDLTIEAGGYLVLYSNKADNATEVEASLVFSAGLSAKQSLKLELRDAGSASVDTYVRGGSPYGETLPENKKASFSRVPDGTGEWAYATPTPGEANGAKTGDIEQE